MNLKISTTLHVTDIISIKVNKTPIVSHFLHDILTNSNVSYKLFSNFIKNDISLKLLLQSFTNDTKN